jgi:signal transduction histidine kinase
MPGLRAPTDWPVDLALAAAVTALNIAGALAPVAAGYRNGGVPMVVLSAVAGLALAGRRAWPLASFLVIAGVVLLATALQWHNGVLAWSLSFAGYALGAFGTRHSALIGLGVSLGAIAALAVAGAPGFDSWLAVSAPAGLLLMWLFGRVVAHRRTVALAARQHAVWVARTSAAASEQAAQAERLRVARDLHDTVTNQLAIIAVHASSRLTAAGAGTAAGAVLARIAAGARSSMDDLRRLLGALRQVDGADDDLDRSVARVTGWTAPERERGRWRPPAALAGDWPTDVALGLAIMAINLVGSLVPDTSDTTAFRDPVVGVLAVLAAVPGLALIVRRRFPVTVLVAVFCVVTVVQALQWQDGTLPGALLVATYSVGAWAQLRRGALAMLGLVLLTASVAGYLHLTGSPAVEDWSDPLSVVAIGAPWVIGILIGRRRQAADRAVQEAREAERAHTIAQEKAIAEERLSVARDLHDVIAHGIAAMAVESAVARRQFDNHDFAVIDDATHAAMNALRAMLDVLQGATPDEPAPGLGELDALVEAHRTTHGPVSLELDPEVAEESASLRLTVHRIVQEALTNVGRHAPGAHATVRVHRSGHSVDIAVEDDGRRLVTSGAGPWAGAGSGLGLAAMRERIALFGGELDAGPAGDDGFRVHARLPRGARC